MDTRFSEGFVPADHTATEEIVVVGRPRRPKPVRPMPPQARPERPPVGSRGYRRSVALVAVFLIGLAAAGVVMVMRSTTSSAPAKPPARPPVAVRKPVVPIRVHITYRTADQVVGYFEEVLTITNRTGAGLRGWTLSFGVGGADVHNIWGATLRRTGAAPVIVGTTTIPAGGSVEVRFGGTGAPAVPRACTLDGRPCTFGR